MGKYPLFTETVQFSESAERFFDFQYQAWQAMDDAGKAFQLWYDERKDILSVLKGYEKKAVELVVQYANKPLFEELPTLEIYDISEKNYDEECLNLSESSDALDAIAEQYNSIVAQLEAEEEYRAERKANRGRVVGGGFGVGGALKGMATAGAMNAISGAGHSIANAIGNAVSAAEAASAKRALYRNSTTVQILKNGIKDDILYCFNAHMHLVNRRKHAYIVSSFDTDKGGAYFENAKKVEDKRIELLLDAFKNYPWNKALLKYLFLTYKVERKHVWDAAKRFHVDLNDVAEETFAAIYTAEAKQSQAKAQAAKNEILAQMQELGITSSETVNQIEQDCLVRILANYHCADKVQRQEILLEIEYFDALDSNKAKVIHAQGIWELSKKYGVCFTPEEVEKILEKVYSGSAKQIEEQAQVAKIKIKEIMAFLGVEKSRVFDSLEHDCVGRLCTNYKTANETTCKSMIDRIKAYDALERNKKPFLQGIQQRIEEIWSAEDGEIFDNLYLSTDIHNPSSIEMSLAFVRQKKRTASSDKYITALQNCNQKNIKKARIFQNIIIKIMLFAGISLACLGIIFVIAGLSFWLSFLMFAVGIALIAYYFNLKQAWDVLTLNGALVHSMLSITGHEQRNPINKK